MGDQFYALTCFAYAHLSGAPFENCVFFLDSVQDIVDNIHTHAYFGHGDRVKRSMSIA